MPNRQRKDILCNLQHEYMSYIEKKTTKRQTSIITLSDHNKQEIRNIQLQREIMEEEFNEKEQGRLFIKGFTSVPRTQHSVL